jgi:hypothetical protein
MLSIITLLFPSCPDLLLEEVTCEGQILYLTIRREERTVACPDCAQESGKVHSCYTRTLADVSWMDYAVLLRVQVRRLFCSNAACTRTTFAEPLTDIAGSHARRTNRQASRLRAIAKELGGRPAARESENVQMPVSRHTLLRLLRRTPVPAAPAPRILGVDDWSLRKGRTYATLLVDLQRHRIVDVLPYLEAQTLEVWLAAHPGVEVITRDRAGAYAQGARKGAPQAQQVTDRFHVFLNLQEALKRMFERKHEQLKHLATWEPAKEEQTGQAHEVRAEGAPDPAQPITVGPKLSPAHEAQRQHRRDGLLQRTRIDWVEAPDVSHFAGREVEVAELSQWIVQERCRLVTLLGMGCIGKSMLASYLGLRLAPHFEVVLWHSVRDAPGCSELVADCITFFSETPPAAFPTSLEQRITQLMARLQASHCLLVLDNLETLLAIGDREGGYLPGYEGYGRLIGRLAESAHQSCVLLTSREKPKEIEPLEGLRSPVRSLRLGGVDEQAAHDLLSDKGLSGTPAAWHGLVSSYAGNPLALKIVAQAVSDLFGGDLDRFLQEGELIFNGVRPVLRQQMGRLSPLEHLLLTWLAVLREWTPLDTLAQVLHPRVLRSKLLEALEALRRRSLVERGQQASFGLQSVVMEYLTDELGERLSEEIVLGRPKLLRQVALAQAQAKDYVRKSQVRLLVQPLLERLRAEQGANAQVEAHLLRLLTQFRTEDAVKEGYGPANVITLLTAQRGHLRGLDLSGLFIRGAYLQGVELQDATLSGALLQESVLTEAFDAIWSVAISQSGQYWAAAGRRGEVRLWRGAGQRLQRVWQAHTDIATTLAFSPDERLLASGSADGSVRLWDVESGAALWSGEHTSTTSWLAFAPDGGLLASGGFDGSVRLWDPQLGTLLEALSHPGPVYRLAWSPDGHLLATGDGAGTLRLWEIGPSRRASCVESLVGHSNWMWGLAFAPDESLLASASWERQAAFACASGFWGIHSRCKPWPGARMEARWPVAAGTTPSGCGRLRRASLGRCCGPSRRGVQPGLHARQPPPA